MNLRSLLLALVLVCTFSAFAQKQTAPQTDKWTGISRYDAQNRALLLQENNGKRVVLMGNSITDFWINRHSEFFDEHPNFIDRGIAGQTSYQMLVRFREDVINLHPKVVVINAGINDIAENQHIPYDEKQTFGNIVSMVELAKANKIKVVLTSVMPASNIYWNKSITGVQLKIIRLNDDIQAYAKKQGIPYVDYYSAMVSGVDKSLNPEYTTDGLHPTTEGYKVMEPLFLEAIQKFVK